MVDLFRHYSLTGMTGELSAEASAQINGAILSTSDTRSLSRTTAAAARSTTGTTSTTGTSRIPANAKITNSASQNVSATGAAASSQNQKMGMTVSLAAFMGTAAYLAL